MSYTIHPERSEDAPAIRELLVAAFLGDAEASLVEDLRAAHALPVSLVALDRGLVIGHLAFSPVSIVPAPETPTTVWALAPLAVAPTAQGRGMGSSLVREGLRRAKEAGCDAVVVLGDPAYYRRFGFSTAAEAGFHCRFEAPVEAFMILAMRPAPVVGPNHRVEFHAAFDRFPSGAPPNPGH